jgi:phenolic acid decarboxylase
MNEHSAHELLDGKTIDYTYDDGWRFRVNFYDGLVAYEFLGDDGEDVSSSNADIPYLSRSLGSGRIHVSWHEENIGDFVSLVIDPNQMAIFSAALLGYRGSDRQVHFEHGVIHSFVDSDNQE